MDEIQNRFNIDWRVKFPSVQIPLLKNLYCEFCDDNSDKKPREILQKLFNATRKRSEDLKSQLQQCEFIELFLQGILAADNDDGETHFYGEELDNSDFSEIHGLKNCIEQSIRLNAGVLLESDIDSITSAKEAEKNQDENLGNKSLPETSCPPKTKLIATEKCDKKHFDTCESVETVDHTCKNSDDQDINFNRSNLVNSSQENEVTTNHFTGIKKIKHSGPPKIPKPVLPPRNPDEVHSNNCDSGVKFVPIKSSSGPIFKSTINVKGECTTFKGKHQVEETDIDSDTIVHDLTDHQTLEQCREEDDNGRFTSDITNSISVATESDTETNKMRKIRKSNRVNEQNVIATSFKRISDEISTQSVETESSQKSVNNTETNKQSSAVLAATNNPPSVPERKPSVNMTELDNQNQESRDRRKRQSRNDYENISLDFILTRSQTFTSNDESPDSEENDEEIYDNVVTSRKQNNHVSEDSLSSGGDNSSSERSPKVAHNHIPTVRDSVFIRDNGRVGEDGQFHPEESSDIVNGVNRGNKGQAEVRVISKATDDDDSTEDNISCDSLDDRKLDEFEALRQERQKKLHMRQIVVKGILESEKTYLQILQEITTIKRTLQTKSLQEHCRMLPLEDLSTIFYKIEEIKQYHQTFVNSLEEKVNNWSDDQEIGEIFKELTFYIPIYKEYVENLNNARDLVQKYCNENSEFKKMVSIMEIYMTTGNIEKTSLEEALFKPVQRLQRNTLVLHDLLSHTPHDHPDYAMLNKALSLADLNIKSFGGEEDGGTNRSQRKSKDQGHLIKSGFVVEVVGNSRKLRFLFLYSDFIVCTKHKVSGRHKVKSFECKWYIAIHNANVEGTPRGDKSYSCKEDIDAMKKRIVSLKAELRREVRRNTESFRERSWSLAGKVSSRNIEKLKKKIEEQEAQLVLLSPHLPLHIRTREDDCKDYIILISTDFEREEWRDAILSQQRHPHGMGLTRELSIHGIQTMINNSTQLPQVNNIGNVLSKNDEEMLSGLLNVTIHNLLGLDQPSDVFVILELDSYGHFFKKAQTHKCMNTTDPTWDEDFELELDGSNTLRVLCYKVSSPTNVLIGRSALELSKEWLSSSFKEQKISMNEISLTISVRHTTAAKTLKRTPSKLQGGIFGFKIKTVTMREGKTIPTFVSSCIRLVEQKGMDEVGIYRISGVTSEIQRIKKAFDKNLRAGLNVLQDADINAVTGALKLYFRELPEPLFTEDKYTQFVDSLCLTDEDSKEKCMLQLLHGLPDVNYYCIVAMIEHLVKVSKHEAENKMSLNNLATIFGPTLLHPAVKDDVKVPPALLMMQGAQDVFSQAAVLYYFLDLLHSGKSIRKSSKLI